jgi:hypothetical protein
MFLSMQVTKRVAKTIRIIKQWPSGIGYQPSAPSLISYRQDGGPHLWGFEVNPEMRSYAWAKLLLDRNSPCDEFDDDLLERVTGSEILRLPDQKEAGEAVADYLSQVFDYIQHHIPEKVPELGSPEGNLSRVPIDFWFTTPARWSGITQFREQGLGRAFYVACELSQNQRLRLLLSFLTEISTSR